MKAKWYTAVDRLRAAGHNDVAEELKSWTSKDNDHRGWDEWLMGKYASLAKIAGLESEETASPSEEKPSTDRRTTLASLWKDIESAEKLRQGTRLFDIYAFADYSGDKKDRRGVVLAVGIGDGPSRVIEGVGSRKSLDNALRHLLHAAKGRGLRVLFGLDHQYGVPIAFAKDLDLPTDNWRSAMHRLFITGFSHAAGKDQGAFAKDLNGWLDSNGKDPYFWSATKGKNYGIPVSRPARADLYRICESRVKGQPFPFCRVGDNGAVGGQTIMGMPSLLLLLDHAESKAIDVRVWPFDGPSINTYGNANVMIEPYPTHVREVGLKKSDENDALACVVWAQTRDRSGTLVSELDLSTLPAHEQKIAGFEGWIAGVPGFASKEIQPSSPRKKPFPTV